MSDDDDRLRLEATRLRAELDEQRLVNSVYRLAIERLVPDEDERFQVMLEAERAGGSTLDPDDIQWWRQDLDDLMTGLRDAVQTVRDAHERDEGVPD